MMSSSHHRVVSITPLSPLTAPSAPVTVDRIGRELRPASMSCPRCGAGGIQLILPGERGPFYFCGNKECLVARYGRDGVHSEIATIRSTNPEVEPDEPLERLKD